MLAEPSVGVYFLGGAVLLLILIRSRKMIGTIGISTLGGVFSLGIVNLASALTGISLPFNVFSLLLCISLGAPGVIGLMLMRLFWM